MVARSASQRRWCDIAPRPPFATEVDAGRREAVEQLYERYAPALRAYCMRRLRNRPDADDAVQETFLKVQQSFHRYDPNAPFWPWAVTIAARVCTDIHRLHERRTVGEPVVASTTDPEEHVARRAKVAIVDNALRSMPERYRTSIYLKHFEDASYEEIADLQGVSLSSVKTTLMRGRRELACRIEAIARADRTWPLPSTVSVVARRVRDRVRSLCHDCNRVLHGAVGMIDSAVSLNAVVAHAPMAMAIVATLGIGTPAPTATTTIAHEAPPAAAADVPYAAPSAPLVVIGDRRTGVAIGGPTPPPPAPFFSVELRPPLAPTGPMPSTRTNASDNDDGSLEFYVEVFGRTSHTWTDCTREFERALCVALRTALPVAEEHDAPGVLDVSESR